MSQSMVLERSLISHHLGAEKRYCIYLPPSYSEGGERRFSTLYLLPGLMDYQRTWVEKGLVNEHMDRLLSKGRLGEMIIVMPDKDEAATAEDRRDDFALYLAQEVIPHIDAGYRTIPTGAHRGVEGLSLGAGWALQMALLFPQLFCSVGCLSGGFDDDTYRDVLLRERIFKKNHTRFRVGTGMDEAESMASSRGFVQFMRSRGFYCELDVLPGGHDWNVWSPLIANSLQFHYHSFNPHR